jgi:hypothetical protein
MLRGVRTRVQAAKQIAIRSVIMIVVGFGSLEAWCKLDQQV